ncbi:MAG: 6,7-dimethyl-8-ribityllumazine synthase [Verrucomicrobia bacterium]|jgi:6,7-dimethyl-8-ribityllumazine synthase|nr:6,7-dimethyl-8-ribityllumazine synthase [Verrucomicrobiota bacterium]
MLKEIKVTNVTTCHLPIAIIASKYNGTFVQGLLDGVEDTLKLVGVAEEDVVTIRVPGAFEIPVMAAKVARCNTRTFAAIICLGVVIQGETEHARLITEAVTIELVKLQTSHGMPIVHEVLLVQNEEQARARCLDEKHNRGREAAQTALEMASLVHEFDKRFI